MFNVGLASTRGITLVAHKQSLANTSKTERSIKMRRVRRRSLSFISTARERSPFLLLLLLFESASDFHCERLILIVTRPLSVVLLALNDSNSASDDSTSISARISRLSVLGSLQDQPAGSTRIFCHSTDLPRRLAS